MASEIQEFRDKNIQLLKDIDALKAKYEGIDPDQTAALRAEIEQLKTVFDGIDPSAARAALTQVAALEKAKPSPEVAALEAQLATEREARVAAQGEVNQSLLKTAVSEAFLRLGGRAQAVDFIQHRAAALFTVDGGKISSRSFSAERPGQPLTVIDFIEAQTRDAAFAFEPSGGSGASTKRAGASLTPGGKTVLRDPSPRQLGEHSRAIARGDVRIEYTNS